MLRVSLLIYLPLFILLSIKGGSQNISREQRFTLNALINVIKMSNDLERIVTLSNRALLIDSNNTLVIAYRALAYYRAKEYKAAMKDFNLFASKKPNSPFLMFRAQLKVDMGDTVGAWEDIDYCFRTIGYIEAIATQLDRFYKKLGNDERVCVYVEEVVKRNPNYIIGHAFLGFQKEKKGDFKGAEKNYSSAIEAAESEIFSGRTDFRYLYRLKAEMSYELKNHKSAIDAITQSILLYPEDPSYYRKRIIYYEAAGEHAKACTDYTYLLKRGIRYSLPKSLSCDFTKNKFEYSSEWQNAIEAEKYFKMGYSSKGSDSSTIHQALILYSKALELNPNHINSLASRSFYYSLLHQPENSLKDLNRILQLKPSSAKAWHYKSVTKRNIGDYDSAIKDAKMAVLCDSGNAEYLVHLAMMKADKGDTNSAYKDLKKVLTLDIYNSKAHFEIGMIELFFKKDYKTALESFSKAIAIDENMPGNKLHGIYHYYNAKAFDNLALYSKALNEINIAISLEPNSADYYYLAGEIKARMKDLDGACQDWGEAKKKGYKGAEEVLIYNCVPK